MWRIAFYSYEIFVKKSVHITDDAPKVGVRKKELQSLLLIRIADTDPIKSKVPELLRLSMEPWRAEDAHKWRHGGSK